VIAVLSRVLTPVDFGIFAAGSVVLELGRPLASLGLDHALVQREHLEASVWSTAFALTAGAAALSAAVLTLLSPLAVEVFDSPALSEVVPFLALALWVHALTQLFVSILKRHYAFRTLSLIELTASTLGSGALAIVLALLGFEYWALVIGYLAEVGLRFAFSVAIILRRHPPTWGQPRRAEARGLLSFGGPLVFSQLFSIAALQGDYFVVGTFLGTQRLGIYSRAYQFVTIPPGIIAALSHRVLFPVLSRVQNDPATVRAASIASVQLASSLALPGAVPLAVLAPELVWILLGDQWGAAVLPLQIMALGVFLRTNISLAGSVVMAGARVRALAVCQGIYAVFVVVGSVLVIHWGVSAVAASTLVAMLAFYVLMTWLMAHTISLRGGAILMSVARGCLAALAASIPCAGTAVALRWLGAPPLAVVAGSLTAGLVGWLAAILAAPRLLLGPAYGLMSELLRRPSTEAR